ncbi:Cell division control protein 7 [Dipsacomyces acuminosporus]|nr:Cell division control protein 7 [Dipsacomyces acuminosporus]
MQATKRGRSVGPYDRDYSTRRVACSKPAKQPIPLFTPEGIPVVQPVAKRPRSCLASSDEIRSGTDSQLGSQEQCMDQYPSDVEGSNPADGETSFQHSQPSNTQAASQSRSGDCGYVHTEAEEVYETQERLHSPASNDSEHQYIDNANEEYGDAAERSQANSQNGEENDETQDSHEHEDGDGDFSEGIAGNEDEDGEYCEEEKGDGDDDDNDDDNDDNDDEDEDEDEDEDDIWDGDIESNQGEIEELERLIPGLAEQYQLLGKIGEGTFSTVYKAIDLQHDSYDNSSWSMIFTEDAEPEGEANAENSQNSNYSSPDLASFSRLHKTGRRRKSAARRARIVAIKKIYVTSSPTRIANEISILNDLKGCRYIAPLVTAMRKEDQVVVVLPYFPNDDFRRFYLDMPIDEIRWYLASLFSALEYAHSKGIMHRDIKPSNFLYDVQRRHGVLVDFGLAEREDDQEAMKHRSRHALQMDSSTAMRIFRSFDAKGRPGIPRKDTRPGLRANRAGTRGFRAPEVLLKIPQQSVAIDMWSAGVILLCFLTRRFPFFQSTDDTEALLEIAVLYGRLEMERAAVALGRTFLTNIPTVKDRGIRFESLAKAYNAEGYPCLPAEVFDLLRRLLALSPASRTTAAKALEHPFVANRRND